MSYPAGWWANDAIPRTRLQYPYAACVGFAPTYFDLACCNGEVDSAIFFYVTKDVSNWPLGEIILREETTVDGRPAIIREVRHTRDLLYPVGTRFYEYLIELGGGDTLVVDTDSLRPDGDYRRDKRVIDKMLQTLRFDP